MTTLKRILLALAAVLVLPALALAAQDMGLPAPTDLASQSLRPYWHVFIAYAIAIAMLLAWVVSMVRKLAALEARLGE